MDQKKLYPVITCSEGHDGRLTASLNVGLALASGADGVLLTGRMVGTSALVGIYRHVRELYPLAWIGVRFPGYPANTKEADLPSLVKLCPYLDALWAESLPVHRLDTQAEILCDVSMQYCNSVTSGPHIKESCSRLENAVTAAIIRGQEKGCPPGMALVSEMRKQLHAKTKLGVAGGVNANNLFKFKYSADYFIVGRAVCENEGFGSCRIAPDKVARLAALLRA